MSFKHILAVLIVVSIALTTAQAVDISSCTNLTTASTTYNLITDLNLTQSGLNFCVKINNTGITLDCGGHRLYGNYSNFGSGDPNSQTGIYINRTSNIVITNCVIDDYEGAGILGDYVNNSNITNNVINRTDNGVLLWTSHGNLIQNNTIFDVDSNGIMIGRSLLADPSAKNNIINLNLIKDAWDSGGACISSIDTTNNTKIWNNTCYNLSYAITVADSNYADVRNNNVTTVEWDAFALYRSNYVNIINNTLYDIGSAYLDISNSNTNNVITNLVLHNSSSNISFSGDLYMQSATDPGTPNSSYASIGKFFEITNSTDAWMSINLSYADSEISGISDESQIVWWKYTNGVGWTYDIGSTNAVDTANNVVYANISNFSSSFLPLGPVSGPSGPSGGVPEFSDFAWVLAAVLGAGSLLLIKRTRKGF